MNGNVCTFIKRRWCVVKKKIEEAKVCMVSVVVEKKTDEDFDLSF